jgi:SAM-dependent methyltransferase
MTDPTQAAALDETFVSMRDATARQLGSDRPAPAAVDPATAVRFSPDLPGRLSPERQAELEARARELDPWLQGPFLLGGDLMVGGAWRNDERWIGLGQEVPESLAGMRVLDVGSNAGYDPFMFNLRGADYVLAAEPFEFHRQALFLESIYRTGVDFQQIGWQDLDPELHGTFDLVHCHGVLYHDPHPVRMLERLRAVLADGGTLLLGSMMLADPELSEFARFVPGSYHHDPTWWWVPGRLTLRWMMEAAGFEVEAELPLFPGPPGAFKVVNGYLRARGGAPSALPGYPSI